VFDELASDETFLYIQRLEKESESLRRQLKETNCQLQSTKVFFSFVSSFIIFFVGCKCFSFSNAGEN
jgi:hypothetical protein